MSYAIIESGGKQFRVTKGQIIKVPLIGAEAGSAVEFHPLLRGDGNEVHVGVPFVDGAPVLGKVLDQGRGPKVIVFKKKRKKQYKKTIGHRQAFTSVLIESIGGEDESTAQATSSSAPTAAETDSVVAAAEPTEVNTQVTDVAEPASATEESAADSEETKE